MSFGFACKDKVATSPCDATTTLLQYVALSQGANQSDDTPVGLNLQALMSHGCSLGVAGLLQVQAALLNFWFDSVQKIPDIDSMLQGIPDTLWIPDIMRTGIKCFPSEG